MDILCTGLRGLRTSVSYITSRSMYDIERYLSYLHNVTQIALDLALKETQMSRG
jgi:hypothetical protein